MAGEESPNRMTNYPLFTLVILFASVLSFISPKIAALLVFDRSAVMQGEAWRLFSSHFVHFSNIHLFYNLLVFSIAGWLVERKNSLHFGLLYLLMASAISITLIILKPAMAYYGGLSGLACGFVFYWALLGLAKPGPWRTPCLLLLFCLPGKTLAELKLGTSLLPYWGRQTFVMMPVGHIAGIIVALVFYIVLRCYRTFPRQQTDPAADHLRQTPGYSCRRHLR
jgi:rhomboid family GlyGly-CTERM serine protease